MIASRFCCQDELGVAEPLAILVQQDRVHAIAEGEIHAGGDKHVLKAVGVDVTCAQSPGPVILGANPVRDLFVGARALLLEEGIPVNAGFMTQVFIRFAPGAESTTDDDGGGAYLRLGLFPLDADVLAHVGVHIGDIDIHEPVVVPVEYLDPHRAPGRLGENFRAHLDEAFAFPVLVVLVGPLHIEYVQVRPAVPVDVAGSRIASPAHVPQAGLFRDIDEAIAALVVIEDALLEALRLEVAGKRVTEAVVERVIDTVIGCLTQFFGRVPAHVGEEQVEQAIPVVVKEHGAGRMAFVPGTGCIGYVAESPAPDVFIQAVSLANSRDVEVCIAVVVDVRERGSDGNSVGQGHARFAGDVFEFAAAGISPQRISAGLGDEQNIQPAVVINVGYRDSVAMIVVHRLVGPRRVLNAAMAKGNATFRLPVGEFERMENLEIRRGPELFPPAFPQFGRAENRPRLANPRDFLWWLFWRG